LDFPRGWTKIGDPISRERRIHVLRKHVDGVDFAALKRLADWAAKPAPSRDTPSSVLSEQLLTSLVRHLEGPRRRAETSDLAGELLLGVHPEDGSRDA